MEPDLPPGLIADPSIWRYNDNTVRSHSSLGNLTPITNLNRQPLIMNEGRPGWAGQGL